MLYTNLGFVDRVATQQSPGSCLAEARRRVHDPPRTVIWSTAAAIEEAAVCNHCGKPYGNPSPVQGSITRFAQAGPRRSGNPISAVTPPRVEWDCL